jgi:hypothetical protein
VKRGCDLLTFAAQSRGEEDRELVRTALRSFSASAWRTNARAAQAAGVVGQRDNITVTGHVMHSISINSHRLGNR